MNEKFDITAVRNILTSHKNIAGTIASISRQLFVPLTVAGIAGLGFAGQASASTIGFQTEVNTGDKLAIRNTSSDGIQIQSVTVTLGDNTLFDTTIGASGAGDIDPSSPLFGLDTTISIAHWDDLDTSNVLRDATGSGAMYDVTSTWNTSTGDLTGYAGTLNADVIDGASVATFRFTDFNPNEAWGFNVDYDTRDGVEDAGGAAMNNAIVEVTFYDPTSGLTHILTSQYGTFNGNRQSFPTDFLDASDNNVGPTAELTAVPVPPAVWLFGSGLLGMVGISRRKKV